MISMDKKYRTRDGREVRIYAVDGNGKWPVHGAIKENEGWNARVWAKDGLDDPQRMNPLDLIEVKPRIQREYWVNVYPNGGAQTLKTKKIADDHSNDDRIACVKVVIDCEEGEGL